jgi:hypothetical protein
MYALNLFGYRRVRISRDHLDRHSGAVSTMSFALASIEPDGGTHFASGVLIAKLRGKYRRSSFVGWRFMVLSLAMRMSPAERALIERESYC